MIATMSAGEIVTVTRDGETGAAAMAQEATETVATETVATVAATIGETMGVVAATIGEMAGVAAATRGAWWTYSSV